jgi:hypothetical protein
VVVDRPGGEVLWTSGTTPRSDIAGGRRRSRTPRSVRYRADVRHRRRLRVRPSAQIQPTPRTNSQVSQPRLIHDPLAKSCLRGERPWRAGDGELGQQRRNSRNTFGLRPLIPKPLIALTSPRGVRLLLEAGIRSQRVSQRAGPYPHQGPSCQPCGFPEGEIVVGCDHPPDMGGDYGTRFVALDAWKEGAMAAHEGSRFREFEHAGWESAEVCATYQERLGGVVAQVIGPMLDAARVDTRDSVLDVATGSGEVAAAAAERGASVTGVDFSAEMLWRAAANHPHLKFERGDADALPFAAMSFDVVVCNFGVPHFADPEAFFRESLRVLRPLGRFAFTVWAAPAENDLGGDTLRPP